MLFHVYNTYPSKEQFYNKHHIENNTLMPPSFDMDECLRLFTESFYKRYRISEAMVQGAVEDFITMLEQDMIPPEQYEGFYNPQDKIIFYNAIYKNNLQKLGLSARDIVELGLTVTEEMVQKWHMNMTTQQLEKEGFYTIADTAQLVAKVGDDIYLTGFYSDCGTSGCHVKIMLKEHGKWYSRKSEIFFDSCITDEQKSVYKCDIYGGNNDLWHYETDYAPFTDFVNRYYEVWNDYVRQYLQKKK